MNYIEKINNDLNTSASGKYETWKEYRDLVMSFIESQISFNVNRILVIGTGSGNDLDLNRLLAFTKKLIITDVDLISLHRSLDRYELSEDHVTLKRVEYSGLESIRFFDTFIKDILVLKDKIQIEQYLEAKINSLSSFEFLTEERNQQDIVIVSPIYTQLAFLQFTDYTEMLKKLNYPKNLTDFVADSFLRMMPEIIDRFNHNLVKLLKPDGKLIVLSDIFEYSLPSIFGKNIEDKVMDFSKMEAFYENYKHQYGMGLGDYGLDSLNHFSKKITSTWMIWPFDNLRKFAVKAVSFENIPSTSK